MKSETKAERFARRQRERQRKSLILMIAGGVVLAAAAILAFVLNRPAPPAAIEVTGAGIVDVSSGVENSPGIKDIGLIREFIAAAKGPR